eukprot:gene9050-12205_t
MVLEDQKRSTMIQHIKIPISTNWVQIRAYTESVLAKTHKESYWLIKRDTFLPIRARMESVDIASTEIAIALHFLPSISSNATGDEDVEEVSAIVNDSKVNIVIDSQALFPIYSYLSTKTVTFRFIVQANFVLSTSRESILEDNDWNKELLERIPSLFVSIIAEMAEWIDQRSGDDKETIDLAARCPMLSQLPTDGYQVIITRTDIYSIIPQHSQDATSNVYAKVIEDIHKKLEKLPFLKNSQNETCSPVQLWSTNHLNFEVLDYVTSENIFRATQKYVLSSESHPDEMLLTSLNIQKFGLDAVKQCFSQLNDDVQQAIEIESDESIIEGLIKRFSLLLLLLRNFTPSQLRPTVEAFVPKSSSSSLIPGQVVLKSSQTKAISLQKQSPVRIEPQNKYFNKIIADLMTYRIWPVKSTHGTTFHSLSKSMIFIQLNPNNSNNWSVAQENCFREFRSYLNLIDGRLFSKEKDDKLMDQSALIKFLCNYFRPSRVSTNGLDELTADLIIRTIILPAYKNWNSSNNDTIEKEGKIILTRRVSAAFLSFYYLSNVSKKQSESERDREILNDLKSSLVVVPVLTARDGKSDLFWIDSQLQNLKSVQRADDIHIGPEFEGSATNILSNGPTTTCLGQIKWKIIDPLVTWFVLGCPIEKNNENNKKNMIYNDEKIKFSTRQITELRMTNKDSSDWRRFLLLIGAINFFGIYPHNGNQLQSQIPQFFMYMSKLLSNAIPIRTDQRSNSNRNGGNFWKNVNTDENQSAQVSLHSSEPKELSLAELILSVEQPSRKSSVKSDELLYLPLFAPAHNDTEPVLVVSEAVHNTMSLVYDLVSDEIKYYQRDPTVSKLVLSLQEELNRLSWIPCDIHHALKRLISSYHSDSNQFYFIAAPRNVIKTTGLRVDDGAHSLHSSLSSKGKQGRYVSSVDMFQFVDLNGGVDDRIRDDFMLKQLEWMSLQGKQSILSSIRFCSELYINLSTCLRGNYKVEQCKRLLSNNNSIVWIPNSINVDDDNVVVEGSMFSFPDVIKSDPDTISNHFGIMGSPVRSLESVYDTKIIELFCRKRYCNRCKLSEGMFGVFGSPMDYRCDCVDAGFGSILRDLSGLVKNSPSLDDQLKLLKYHRDCLLQNIEGYQEDKSLKVIGDILNIISSNIWKCCCIHRSLHPYSSKKLAEMIEQFKREKLLYVFDNISELHGTMDQILSSSVPKFVSLSENMIAIDDFGVFETFKNELTEMCGRSTISNPIHWIIAGDQNASVTSIYTPAQVLVENLTYSYEAIVNDELILSELSHDEFNKACRTISPLTFFAPKSTLIPLVRLLGIPSLSERVETNWTIVPDSTPRRSNWSACDEFISFMNILVKVTQAFIFNKSLNRTEEEEVDPQDVFSPNVYSNLPLRDEWRSVLNVIVVRCKVIQRKMRLNWQDKIIEKSHDELWKISTDEALNPSTAAAGTKNNSSSLSVHLHHNLEASKNSNIISPKKRVHDICISILTSILKLQIALIESNQKLKLMKELSILFTSCSNSQLVGDDLITFMRIKELTMPENEEIWCLNTKLNEQSSDQQGGSNGMTMSEEKRLELLAGYDRLGVEVKEREKMRLEALAARRASEVLSGKSNQYDSHDSYGPSYGPYDQQGSTQNNNNNRISSHPNANNSNFIKDFLDDVNEQNVNNHVANNNSNHGVNYHDLSTTSSHVSSYYNNDNNNNNNNNLKDATDNINYYHDNGDDSLDTIPIFYRRYVGDYSIHTNKLWNNINVNNKYDMTMDNNNNNNKLDNGLSSFESFQLNISENFIHNLFSNNNKSNNEGNNDKEELLLTSSNIISGRLGEKCCYDYFESMRGEWGLSDVKWENEVNEQLKPYDIVITYPDGKKKLCEVKTRSLNYDNNNDNNKQLLYPLSYSELIMAMNSDHRHDYFCAFINLKINYEEKRGVVDSIRLVGLNPMGIIQGGHAQREGLLSAIENKEVQLLVQEFKHTNN